MSSWEINETNIEIQNVQPAEGMVIPRTNISHSGTNSWAVSQPYPSVYMASLGHLAVSITHILKGRQFRSGPNTASTSRLMVLGQLGHFLL